MAVMDTKLDSTIRGYIYTHRTHTNTHTESRARTHAQGKSTSRDEQEVERGGVGRVKVGGEYRNLLPLHVYREECRE